MGIFASCPLICWRLSKWRSPPSDTNPALDPSLFVSCLSNSALPWPNRYLIYAAACLRLLSSSMRLVRFRILRQHLIQVFLNFIFCESVALLNHSRQIFDIAFHFLKIVIRELSQRRWTSPLISFHFPLTTLSLIMTLLLVWVERLSYGCGFLSSGFGNPDGNFFPESLSINCLVFSEMGAIGLWVRT